ncbi:ribosome maturation factor RimP [Denitrobaculum tricleocarpae]|uniref:Ribosome maturation factor RimP n=1 Tax=Denitrobaculum tricleocarpae TaxID=2591009 RepID=A0A545TRY4_9PROT|nr:ribosome maturation factor RimP [Denitrobaculum tricleocarpae]TQV79990.1 ribosome maturation factor RimP [Denitrobaculum tricleocarpae]
MTKRAKTSEGLAARVEELIAPTIEDMDYDIVRVRLGGDRRTVLQIMAERRDEAAMTVEDCADISRAVAAILDVEDPISQAYELEVSSPGLDRPLTRLTDFERFAGFEAKVETSMPMDGRRRFSGRLLGVEGENVTLTVDGQAVSLPFEDIAKAKLVLTDELIAAHQDAQH